MRLEGKTALITGGSRGIGRSCVERLAAEGAKVAFLYRSNAEAAESLASALKDAGRDVRAIQADVTDAASIQPATAAPNTAADMLEANAQAIPVQTGIEQDDWIEVRGDIAAGTQVVVRGNERIPPARPGAPPSRVTWRRK